jgi:hypothetical protein
VLFGTNTETGEELWCDAEALSGTEAGATLVGMPKEDDIEVSSSSNGASPNGLTPDGFIDDEDRVFVRAQQARFAELHEQFVAEGGDSSKELAALRARAATWSR